MVSPVHTTDERVECGMPIYEYRCPLCGLELEKLQRMKDPPPQCPDCAREGQKTVRMDKQVSRFDFHLKGGGWAEDNYS